jgi:hypothetical protein
MSDTPDHHAVLVLQPTVGVFFFLKQILRRYFRTEKEKLHEGSRLVKN